MRNVLCIIFSFFILLNIGAQNNRRKEFSPELFKRKLEQFITREAGLTPAEGQRFFPLLHEMLEKQRTNNDYCRDMMRNAGDNSNEAKYQQVIEQSCSLEIENKKIEKQYLKKFHDVLSWKKIYKVRRAMVRFQVEVLKRFSPPQHEPEMKEHRQWNWNQPTRGNIPQD